MARVLLFGRLADVAGWREAEAPAQSLEGLRASLSEKDPRLAEALASASVKAAVNQTIVHGDAPLQEDDEVAFLPPMSGG